MSFRTYHRFTKSKNTLKASKIFMEINPHTEEAPIIDDDYIIVTSIDSGVVNCGMYIECLELSTMKRRSLKLVYAKFNDGDNHYAESINFFDKFEEETKLFSSSHYIVVESQDFSETNRRMGQHILTYFATRFKDVGNLPIIVEITNQAKTKYLDYVCPEPPPTAKTKKQKDGWKKRQVKKWSKCKAPELLEERDDPNEKPFIERLKQKGKGDDIADAVCQSHAWFKILLGKANRPTIPSNINI